MSYTTDQVMAEINRVMEEDVDEFWFYPGSYELFGQKVTEVASTGGEGQGDEAWVVFKVGDQLFRKNGYYSSWDGFNWSEYSELEEVKPKEVIRTIYVSV